jgi:hypothetical protein
MKKKKKKKKRGVEIDEHEQQIGGSAAIQLRAMNQVAGDMELEDIVNDNEQAYVNEHHTEIQNHGGSSIVP